MAIGNDRFTRTRMLFKDDFERLQHSSVLILGVGGVGGFALDCLYRTGVGHICIVDDDIFEVTNQNRQLGSEALGEPKVLALSKQYAGITHHYKRVNADFLRTLNVDDYDVVLDCVDDLDAKVEIAFWCYKKLFSSMGSAKRLNPIHIQVDSIWKAQGDAFARKYKTKLKKANFKGNFKVVFSSENRHCKELGSCEAVTGSFGLQLASEALRKIIQK